MDSNYLNRHGTGVSLGLRKRRKLSGTLHNRKKIKCEGKTDRHWPPVNCNVVRCPGSVKQPVMHKRSWDCVSQLHPSIHCCKPRTGIKLAIVAVGYPEQSLSYTEGEFIKNFLIDQLFFDKLSLRPKFENVTHGGDVLLLNCYDEDTRTWLKTILKKCPWGEMNPRLLDASELVPPIKTLVFIPGPQEETSRLLTFLRLQNKFDTRCWRVISKESNSNGQFFVIYMDESSWLDIKKNDCRPFFKLGRVHFKVLKRPACNLSLHQSSHVIRPNGDLQSQSLRCFKPDEIPFTTFGHSAAWRAPVPSPMDPPKSPRPESSPRPTAADGVSTLFPPPDTNLEAKESNQSDQI